MGRCFVRVFLNDVAHRTHTQLCGVPQWGTIEMVFIETTVFTRLIKSLIPVEHYVEIKQFLARLQVTAPEVNVLKLPADVSDKVSVAVTLALSTSVITMLVRLSGISSV
jgi:hypothetical protein